MMAIANTSDRRSARLPGAVIFDLDDTLYPSSDYSLSALRAVADYLRLAYGWRLQDELLAARPGRDVLRSVTDVLAHRVGEVDAGLLCRLEAVIATHRPAIALFNDARVCLATLSRMGIRTGLVASGDAAVQRMKVRALDVSWLISTTLFTADLAGPDQAADALGLMAMDLDLPIESMVFAGGVGTDEFVAARQLGMPVIRVERRKESGAGDLVAKNTWVSARDRLASSLDEVPDLLMQEATGPAAHAPAGLGLA